MSNFNSFDEQMMFRCLQLAQQGKYFAPPNPLVGAVLVYDQKIIGEGYHQQYGQAHAEVNCLKSVAESNRELISQSTLYVSLEPCAHHGKTPPCADLIIANQIPKVVIGCRDSFDKVDGKGIEKMKAANIDVTVGVLENEAKQLNKRFFTFHEKKRPFIMLKWAKTADGFIGNFSNDRLLISNDIVNRTVHEMRAENMAIMVGTNTVMKDNPSLTNRLAEGKSPIRLIIDKQLALSKSLNVFSAEAKTIVFNYKKNTTENYIDFVQLNETENLVPQILKFCYQQNIQSIFVEGGSRLLSSFIENNLWDEAVIVTNEKLSVKEGITTPSLTNISPYKSENILDNKIDYFANSMHATE